jgi:nucleoside 2-deoxyribosyltransferase
MRKNRVCGSLLACGVAVALALGACGNGSAPAAGPTEATETAAEATTATGEYTYDVYISSPFFNEEELENVKRVEKVLDDQGLTYFSPRQQSHDLEVGSYEWGKEIFDADIKAADEAAMMIVVYYGNYSDTGTAFEEGYFYRTGKPVVVAHARRDESANLMITYGATTNLYLDELAGTDLRNLEKRSFEGSLV